MSIRIRFKQVCGKCPHRETQTEESALNSDKGRFMVDTLIFCKHEKVCKMYIEWDGPTISEALSTEED